MLIRPIFLVSLVAAVVACQDAAPSGAKPKVSAAATASASGDATASATAAAGKARAIEESNDLYEFDYAYPAAAGAIPALRTIFDKELDDARAQLIADAKEQRAAAQKNDFPYRTISTSKAWEVVADLPDWLSLSGNVGSYSGGAHPNHGFTSLLWDKRANVQRQPLDLFVSKEALSRAIRADFCDAIDKQRAEKRGARVDRKSGDMFSECIDPVESTVILGSSNRRVFDRIGVLVGPYEAGPYAEGDYEATLPVTPAVLAAVKPQYRSSFAVTRR